MQFIYILDDINKLMHEYLVCPIEKDEFKHLKEVFEESIPSISFSAVIRKGHPQLLVDYGSFRSAIPLDEVFGSGEMLGDKLEDGDILTIILSDLPQDEVFVSTGDTMTLNVPLEDLIAYSFVYTEEMQEIYSFYKFVQRMKSEKFDGGKDA